MTLPCTAAELAKLIDHSLLHPTMTDADVKKGLEIGAKYKVASCCVKPYSVPTAVKMLAGTGVAVCSVMAFPHGNQITKMKVAEAQACMADGATELDMVINDGKALSGEWGYVEDEIRAINEAAVAGGAKVKVIFENDYLADEQIIRLCQICSKVKVGWVKTSTGYGFVKQASGDYNYKGATEHHLKLMRANTDAAVGVKAAGGVRSLADLIKVRQWCTRVGATATQVMIDEAYKVERGEATVGVAAAGAKGGY
jgi:deoxyribose-phosphate aldolase